MSLFDRRAVLAAAVATGLAVAGMAVVTTTARASWTANSLTGSWTPLAATQSNPFLAASNTTFSGSAWTQDLSSGEAIRSGYDQSVTISPCHLRYLYQGKDPSANQSYNLLPWRIGLATQTNSTC